MNVEKNKQPLKVGFFFAWTYTFLNTASCNIIIMAMYELDSQIDDRVEAFLLLESFEQQ